LSTSALITFRSSQDHVRSSFIFIYSRPPR
jgi:hypothetical protein